MGNITDRPKAPSPQIVYVPQPVYTELPSSGGAGAGGGGVSDAEKEQALAAQREQSLLSRGRSRLGTILTGFRGLLAPSDSPGQQRKTLLGE